MGRRGTAVLGLALAVAGVWGGAARAQQCQASQVKDIHPGPQDAFSASGNEPPAALGNVLFFVADDGQSGRELWRTDGTAAGTFRLRDIRPGPEGSEPRSLTVLGRALLFVADDGARGAELWRSDGTPGGTLMVRDVRPGAETSDPRMLTPMGGALYFIANDGEHDREIWRTDGTAAGTFLLRDINVERDPPGIARGVYWLAATSRALYASVTRGEQYEIWRSDGSGVGTRLVGQPYPVRPHAGTFLGPLVPVGDTLFFTGELAPEDFRDLWKIDGAQGGMTRVRSIPFAFYAPTATALPGRGMLLWAGDYVVQNLWRSDGTAPGTSSLGSLPESVHSLARVGGSVFFAGSEPGTGMELYWTDGDTVRLVRDIHTGQAGSNPEALASVGGRLLFTATGPSGLKKIWTSDGTDAGTVVFVDVSPAALHGAWLAGAGSRVFFTAHDPASGLELWAASDCRRPILQCPEPVTGEATSAAGATVTYPPASGPGTIRYDHPSGSVFPLGATTVTATAASGATCSFTVTVRDTTPPALSCPPDQRVQAAGGAGVDVAYPAATATDAVSTPDLRYSQAAGSQFSVGVTEVTVTATDAAGNASSCSFAVTVEGAGQPDEPGSAGSPLGSGCACSASSAASGMAPALLLLLARAMRRRRAR